MDMAERLFNIILDAVNEEEQRLCNLRTKHGGLGIDSVRKYTEGWIQHVILLKALDSEFSKTTCEEPRCGGKSDFDFKDSTGKLHAVLELKVGQLKDSFIREVLEDCAKLLSCGLDAETYVGVIANGESSVLPEREMALRQKLPLAHFFRAQNLECNVRNEAMRFILIGLSARRRVGVEL